MVTVLIVIFFLSCWMQKNSWCICRCAGCVGFPDGLKAPYETTMKTIKKCCRAMEQQAKSIETIP